MADEHTTSATFTASPEALERLDKLLEVGDEFIVKAPWECVRWYLEDGTVKERRQDIRERIVRCRDCKHGEPFCDSSRHAGMIDCLHFAQWDYYDDEPGVCPVEPDGFCAWGERRDA